MNVELIIFQYYVPVVPQSIHPAALDWQLLNFQPQWYICSVTICCHSKDFIRFILKENLWNEASIVKWLWKHTGEAEFLLLN